MPTSGQNNRARHLLAVSIMSFSILPSTSSAAEGWTSKADMPTPRHSFAASVVNGKIYAVGGRGPGNQPLSTVEAYDPATDTWTRKADMPTGRFNLATCSVNGKIYAISGSIGSAGLVRAVEAYDPATDTWTKKADIPLEVVGPCAAVVNRKIYVILTHVQIYDPATDTWSVGAETPRPRIPSVSVVDSKIYVIGGRGWDPPWAPFSIVDEYDPVTDTWTRKADIPTPRHDLSTCAVNRIIYAIGGYPDVWDYTALPTVEAYIPESDTWIDVPNMQIPRYSLSTCTLNGDIYAIGGNPSNGAVEVYEAAPWGFAANPNPADGALHLATWVNLTWTPGDFAASHDLYLSDNFEDVDRGAIEAYRGNQTESSFIAGFEGFAYPEGLARGTTYYWRIDEINDPHPEGPWRGDVWKFTIPSKKAYDPFPADGAESVDLTVELDWTSGIDAIFHTVYFGENFDDVDDATGNTQQVVTKYDPGPLKRAKTYYWRVDESGVGRGSETHKGNVWSFTTVGFVVDDFESYNDIDPPDPASNRIFDNWIDGLDTADNGAIVGYDYPPYAEQTVVHGGSQSMPFHYHNNFKSSEAVLTLASQRDWTRDGVGALSLWLRGYPASLGSFTEGTDGTFTINAEGTRIGWKSDECYFSCKALSGPGSIVARVDSIEGTTDTAVAAVMIRETLDPDSMSACAYFIAYGEVGFHQRESRGSSGVDAYQHGITSPRWLKLERDVSDTFRAFHSADGFSWQPVENSAPAFIPMRPDVYIGLAVASRVGSHTCEAVFSNVTITGTVSSEWISRDIGISTNDAEPLYVAIANSGSEPAVVYHDDPAATNIDTWTEWIIPFQSFADQGVDLTDVDSIAIGLGLRGNTTTRGGSGKMYFDDIRLCQPESATGE